MIWRANVSRQSHFVDSRHRAVRGARASLWDHTRDCFEGLDDWRKEQGKGHPLADVVLIALIAIIFGADDADEISAKSNEITAISLLLKQLRLEGCPVTIDAAGCLKEIARAIGDGGGDYVLAVKRSYRVVQRPDCILRTERRSLAGDPTASASRPSHPPEARASE